MNKKVMSFLLSFLSLTLIGAEQEMKMRSAKRREAQELQVKRAKRVKIESDKQIDDEEIEDTESNVFSFDDFEKKLKEIMGDSPSNEQLEQAKEKYSAVEEINKHIAGLKSDVNKVGEKHNLNLFLLERVKLDDGKALIALGKALTDFGNEESGKKLERIGVEIEDWKFRREQVLNNAVSKFFSEENNA
jgi:DNA polymerase II small subunit/DNA polymerase delta subunit B